MRIIKDKEAIYLSHPLILNVELTDVCPLSCPYCYKDLSNTKELDYSVLVRVVSAFRKNGGSYILLSGGEPLLYTRLIDTIRLCTELHLKSALSTSGFGLDLNMVSQIVGVGLGELFISLNSIDKRINDYSRDGYSYAMKAIDLCEKMSVPFKLNTVVRKENISHLEELISYAKGKGAQGIDLLMNKPNNNGEAQSSLEYDDLNLLVNLLERYEGFLEYQSCFIPLKSYYNKTYCNQSLNPILKGCPAGKYLMTMFSDGTYAACPHSEKRESYKDIMEYWNMSEEVKRYRTLNELDNKYCASCAYSEYCSPCVTFEAYKNCWSDYGREITK